MYLRKTLGLLQHHDAVTGTSNEKVTSDYINKLNDSLITIKSTLKQKLIHFLHQNANKTSLNLEEDLIICIERNCPGSVHNLDNNPIIFYIIYNPGLNNTYPIKLNFNFSNFEIKELNNIEEIEAEYDIICDKTHEKESSLCTAYILLKFERETLFKILVIKRTGKKNHIKGMSFPELYLLRETEYIIKNNPLITFNLNNNNSFNVFNNNTNTFTTFQLNHAYYYNQNFEIDVRSGAYIMSLNTVEPNLFDLDLSKCKIFKGKYLTEIQFYYKTSKIEVRFYNKLYPEMFEVESIINPDLNSNNYEFMLYIKTNINNLISPNSEFKKTEFWTDSNGMKMVRRIKDLIKGNIDEIDDDFSSNFYPVNSIFAIKDLSKKSRNILENIFDIQVANKTDSIFTIFNDRPQGMTSYDCGEILVDLHRTSNIDDRKGLQEGLEDQYTKYNYLHLNHWITVNSYETDYFKDQINNIPIVATLQIENNSSLHNDECKNNL